MKIELIEIGAMIWILLILLTVVTADARNFGVGFICFVLFAMMDLCTAQNDD